MITKQIDKFTHIPKEYLSVTPPFPKAIKIDTTRNCNLECDFCANKDSERKGDMNPGMAYRLITEAKEYGVEKIGLFYLGEPLLDRNMAKYIKYAKEIGVPYVFLTSNGTLANMDRLQPLFDAGLDSLKLSVDNINEHPEILENIKQIKKYDGKKANSCRGR